MLGKVDRLRTRGYWGTALCLLLCLFAYVLALYILL
jgi:hypothetical protein